MAKKSNTKARSVNKQSIWIFIVAGVLLAAGLVYWMINSNSKAELQTTKKGFSAELIRANKLTQDVYYYVEQVEMKKMSPEEAKRLSEPIKVELQNIRNQLAKEELMYNDSIRKVFGNIMVDNVMKWRKENGLIVPEENIPAE